jgi:RHS repeat-associated protein
MKKFLSFNSLNAMHLKCIAIGVLMVTIFIFDAKTQNGGFMPTTGFTVPPGTLPGSIDVSASGAATYFLPIELPEGIGGLKPGLGISYNSQSGNGLLGYGWNLSGISAITRVPKSFLYDGEASHISFTANDRFALDGQRLLVTVGTYGADTSRYSTENYTFHNIRSIGPSASNPTSFKIVTTDSTTMEYAHRIFVPGSTTIVYMWLISKVTDRRGNYMQYIYSSASGGQVRLSEIKYSGNTPANIQPLHTVSFKYSTKSSTFRDHYYVGGRKFENNLQLDSVVVSNGRKYAFTLNNNKLEEIKYYHGNTMLVNPTKINWGTETNSSSFDYVDTTGEYLDLEDKVSIVGDFTGNGKNEVMVIKDGNWKLFSMITDNKHSLIASGDFPANNKSGIFSYTDCYWDYYDLGGGLTAQELKCFTHAVQRQLNLPYTIVDINGDGILNMCFIERNSNGKFAFRAYDIINGTRVPKSGYQIEDIGSVVSSDAIITGDFNGNGRTDILIGRKNYQDNQGLDLDGAFKVHFVNLNNFGTNIYSIYAAKFRNSSNNQLISNNGHQMRVYNAIRNVQGKYTFSNIASTPYSSTPNPFTYSGDYNGDGLIDVLIYNESLKKWQLRLSNGISSFLLQPDNQVPILGSPSEFYFENPYEFQRYHDPDNYNFSNTFKNVYIAGDFNGDGKTDIVRFHREVKIRFTDCPWGGGLIGPLVDPKDHIPDCESIHDFVASYYVYIHYATGVGFTLGNNNKINGASFQYPVDVYPTNNPPTLISNGDGVTGSIEYLRVARSIWGNHSGKFPLLTGDFRNNGIQQITLTSKHGHGNPKEGILQFHTDIHKNLVTELTNGNGIKTEINYQWLHNPSVYTLTKTPVSSPLIERHLPIRVVAGIKTQMPISSSVNTLLSDVSYHYKTARMHITRGFLGFKETVVYDDISKMRITSTFDLNTDFFVPYLKQVDVRKNSTLLSRTTNTPLFESKGTNMYLYYMQKVQEQDFLTGVIKIREQTLNHTLGTLTQTLETFRRGSTIDGTIKTEYTNNGPFNQPTLIKTIRTQGGGSPFIQQSQFSYYNSSSGNVHTITDNNDVVTTYTYEPDSTNVKTVTNSVTGIVTSYFYDVSKRFAQRIETRDPSDNTLLVDSAKYNPDNDQLLYTKDFNGLLTKYSYDNYGALAKTTHPDNNYNIDEYGWVNKYQWYQKTYNTLGDVTTVHYDLAGREVQTKSKPAGGTEVTISMVYNRDGTLKETNSSVDSLTSYVYLTNGRLRSITSKGRTENFSYPSGSNAITRTVNGVAKTEVFNSMGQPKTVTDPGGIIGYVYHPSGQPSSIVYNGVSTSITYDAKGRQVALIDPNAGKSTYVYNNLNQIIEQIDGNNVKTILSYDNFGRITQKSQADRVVSYQYYTTEGLKGLLHSVTDQQSGITTSYGYDALGRVTRQTDRIDGIDYDFFTSYDARGRVDILTYPYGISVKHTYAGHYLKSMVDNQTGQNLLFDMEYNTRSQLTSYKTNQGRSFFQGFDSRGYPASTAIGYSSTNHNKDVTITYQIDPITLNMRERRKYSNNGATLLFTESFTYDPLDRLTQWKVTNSGGVSNTYTVSFINNGNIAQKSDMGLYSYSSQKPNAVVSISSLSGQAHTVADNEIFYTPFNKTSELKNFQTGQLVSSYNITYGPDDQRRKSHEYSSDGGSGTTTIYSGLFEERSNGDRLYHISSPVGIAALVVTNKHNASKRDIYYLYNDYQGSLIAVQKKGSTTLEQMSYDPWGRRRSGTNWLDYENINTPFTSLYKRGYTGHEHIDAFGLINMNGRMYDARLARFLSPDPYIQSPDYTQSYNRFSYCWNNPMKYVDPDGEFVWMVPVLIGAIIGGYSGYKIGKAKGAEGWSMAGYIFGGAVIGGVAGYTGFSVYTSAFTAGVGAAGIGGGISAGFHAGMLSGMASGAITGGGMAALGGGGINDILAGATMGAWFGGVTGGISGAIGGGLHNMSDQLNFWGNRLSSNTHNLLASLDPTYLGHNNGWLPQVTVRATNLMAAAASRAAMNSAAGYIMNGAAIVTTVLSAGSTAALVGGLYRTGANALFRGGMRHVANKGTHLVYQGFDKAGVVRYVGITGRDASVRFGEHLSSGTLKSMLRYDVIPGATNLTKTGARAWEQSLINQFGLQKNGGLLINKINSIAPKNWWQFGIIP